MQRVHGARSGLQAATLFQVKLLNVPGESGPGLSVSLPQGGSVICDQNQPVLQRVEEQATASGPSLEGGHNDNNFFSVLFLMSTFRVILDMPHSQANNE